MYELAFDEYELAYPLFHAGPETYTALCFDAAQAGTMAARLWVDDPAAPRMALLWDQHLCFDLAGSAHEPATIVALSALWGRVLLPQVQGRAAWCKVRYILPAWEGTLPAIFGAAPLHRRGRRLYTFGEVRIPDAAAQVPSEFALVD